MLKNIEPPQMTTNIVSPLGDSRMPEPHYCECPAHFVGNNVKDHSPAVILRLDRGTHALMLSSPRNLQERSMGPAVKPQDDVGVRSYLLLFRADARE